MKAKSCYSTKMDPYRAGIEIGQALSAIDPEVIFLFPSIHYQGSSELIEAIYDALDSKKAILIGNTGDGFYEQNKVAHTGVSALAINSNGRIRWHLASEEQAGADPELAAHRCLEKVKKACEPAEPSLYFMSCDFRMDTTKLVKTIQAQADRPFIGGSASDDYSFNRCFVYANDRILEDAIAILGMEGDFPFEILVSQEMHPVGNPGKITQSYSTTISTIDGMPADHFIEQETGRPLSAVDEGVLTLKLMGKNNKEPRLRSVMRSQNGMDNGKVSLFGGVNEGDISQICYATLETILEDLDRMGAAAGGLPFEPVAGLMISCAGRKRVLGDHISMEVGKITQACPGLSALAGYPSFGEFGPLKENEDYSRTLFHNMTSILLLIGTPKP